MSVIIIEHTDLHQKHHFILKQNPTTFAQKTALMSMLHYTLPGLEIATDTVANATNIFSWATKNSGLVATLLTRKQTVHLILLCFCHKKCAKSHKQSQFTSKFIPTSVHDIFKQSNLIGLGIQVSRDFQRQICGNFRGQLSLKTIRKKWPISWEFSGQISLPIHWFCHDLTGVFKLFNRDNHLLL